MCTAKYSQTTQVSANGTVKVVIALFHELYCVTAGISIVVCLQVNHTLKLSPFAFHDSGSVYPAQQGAPSEASGAGPLTSDSVKGWPCRSVNNKQNVLPCQHLLLVQASLNSYPQLNLKLICPRGAMVDKLVQIVA